jgi:hypothetical protein
MTKFEETRRIKREASPIKSRLLDLLRQIESKGLKRDADQLSNIIGRLEDWQNK